MVYDAVAEPQSSETVKCNLPMFAVENEKSDQQPVRSTSSGSSRVTVGPWVSGGVINIAAVTLWTMLDEPEKDTTSPGAGASEEEVRRCVVEFVAALDESVKQRTRKLQRSTENFW